MTEAHDADRLNRHVDDMLRGKRGAFGAADVDDREALMAAASLAAAKEAYPAMSPAFRQRLAAKLAHSSGRSGVSRRSAITAGIGLGVGLAGAAALVVAKVTTNPVKPDPDANNVIEPYPGRWIDVGALSDFVDGQAVMVTAGAVQAYVFRRGEETRGLSAICSHLPCTLDWNSSTQNLICPCHQVSFDASGKALATTYQISPLSAVRTRVQDGRVEVLGT
ncbi:MAG TPA: Rieske 2Fe-2S domain-containing protein [Candidatus Dormibacteraeota bacterium]|jgi:nitrite reductase/ring-hydroxylating ferredoxin subunit|nr:Rieske 2Fe-2S domain-containing protein [Candidatus Dormibacteraeota bacterium]